MGKRRRWFDNGIAWTVGLGATVAFASGQDASGALRGSRYVAMGSSYAAGFGIGEREPGSAPRCDRTSKNYAHLLASRLQLDLVDVSCSGATTRNVLSAWNDLRAQIDAVTPDTRLVTITIGGNDVNYIGELYRAVCVRFGPQPCQAVVTVSEADWTALEDRMRLIARGVRRRAPASLLVFVDYLKVIPDTQACAALPLDADQLARSRAIFQRLAALTARIANEEHADLLPAGELSSGHEACSANPWTQGYPAKVRPWHPTAAGHVAIADAMVKLLQP